MKFEAEIIKEIVDSRGHKKTSIHYQSECVEEWVKEVEGAYPKLCDYQPEWLNYSAENKIGVFPYETVTANPTATVNNAVPYAYKSAILKGNTLVNLNGSGKSKNSSANVCDFTMTYLNPNTTYTIIFEVSYSGTESNGTLGFLTTDKTNWNVKKSYSGNGSYKELLTTTSSIDLGVTLRFRRNVVDGNFTVSNVIVLEGDYTNVDIPYFEGMQTVKMPVLTTVGKNLWDGNWYEGYSDNGGGGNLANATLKSAFRTDYILCSFNDKITVEIFDNTVPLNNSVIYYNLFDNNYNRISTSTIGLSSTNRTLIINNNQAKYIVFHVWNSESFAITTEKLMVVRDDVITAYEPYKSNILRTPSDLELRGIDNVQDELNLLTGKLKENFVAISCNGTEDWRGDSTVDNIRLAYILPSIREKSGGKVICDKLPTVTDNKSVGVRLGRSGGLYVQIDASLGISVNEWLSSNEINIIYEKRDELKVVKTVDLKVTNQDGETLSIIKPIEGTMHVETSGSTINPTAVLEVPVEAITQNLASFIEGE